MNVVDKPSIIWCDVADIYNLETKCYTSNFDIWSDYFNELLLNEGEIIENERIRKIWKSICKRGKR